MIRTEITTEGAIIAPSDIKFRILFDRFFETLLFVLASLCALPLIFIFGFITYKGVSALSLDFFLQDGASITGAGGIAHALLGSFLVVILASLIAIPIGIASGIYASEHRHSKISYYLRMSSELLQGVPSIIIGIIAAIWIVMPMSLMNLGSFSALAGAIALSIMMLPMIVKSTEETLKLIPNSLKEASIALGVPYYKTVLKVILPSGLSGIVTGVLIAIARIAGETAPLLFTSFVSKWINLNILKPTMTLPLLIYNYSLVPDETKHEVAWGGSFVLLIFVLLLNIITKVVVSRWKVKF